MAYTRPWDETTPVGSIVLANDIDLVFRQLKQDVRERMNSLVNDWTADPVALKLSLLGGPQILHHSAFRAEEGNAGHDDDEDYLSNEAYTQGLVGGGGGVRTLRCSVRFPVGSIVTAISFLADRNNAIPANMTFYFKKVTYDTSATVTSISSKSTTANGLALWDLTTALPYTVLANTMYFLAVDFVDGGANRFYGAKVTY